MAEVTIEIDDKGNIGTLPEPLQKFLDGRINDAFKRGAEKVEKEFAGKVGDPSVTERLRLLEDENSRYKEAEHRRKKEYEEADKIKEERHAAALKDREDKIAQSQAEIERRTSRLRQALGSEIRAAAVAAGAREESLAELVKLLGADVDLDADLNAFVKGEDGKPRADKDGKPVTVEGFVTQYLATHPHHLRKAGGVPGRSTDGASFRARGGAGSEAEDALGALQQQPNLSNLAKAIGARRRMAS